MENTIVLGASPDTYRYSYLAVQRLVEKGIPVFPIGIREGEIQGVDIIIGKPSLSDVHTVTIYLNVQNQKEYYDYIINLKPKRIIFNPGAENIELMKIAEEAGIETKFECTLVLLSIGSY